LRCRKGKEEWARGVAGYKQGTHPNAHCRMRSAEFKRRDAKVERRRGEPRMNTDEHGLDAEKIRTGGKKGNEVLT
jgi:hypothetical protein